MMMNLIKDCITFFQAGGVFMYPLAACSVLLIAAVIYRMFNMKKSLICPVVLTRAVEQYTRGAVGRTELERIAADSDSVEGRLVLDALNSPLEDEASLKEMIQVKAREEFVTLQAGLPLLDIAVARLAIATPAVIAHVYYSRKLERISASMEVLLTELVSFRCHHSQR